MGNKRKACEGCGSPNLVLVKVEGLEKTYRCEYCGLDNTGSDSVITTPEFKKCHICGKINLPDTKICQDCGTQIRHECPNCEKLIDLDAKYCPYCKINIQSYIEDRRQRQAELERAEELRRISKLESEIQSLQSGIDSKEQNIRQARRKIDTIRKSGSKLNYFGKAGLSEEEKLIYSQLNSNIGCWTKAIAIVLGITAMDLGRQLFIALTATSFYALQPASPSQSGQLISATFVLCISVFLSIGVGWLVYCLIMMFARQKAVNYLASEQERWFRDLQTEKRDLQNMLERLKRELKVAKSQAL